MKMVFFTEESAIAASRFEKHTHVALIVETSNEYARGLLRGIKSYIREHKPWSIYLGEQSRGHIDLSWLQDWKGDGIIARIETPEIAEAVRSLSVPTVNLSTSRFLPGLPCVETNNESIACIAAKHLMERGFKQFGYCGDTDFAWSNQRSTFFSQSVREAGFSCYVYETGHSQSWLLDRKNLATWLSSLPKPIGIMACYDILGHKLLESCRLAGIAVPDEVSVIGVDNDELLCNLSDPPLSSVMPNTLSTGYKAASLLDRMMSGETIEPELYLIEPIDIVTRMSTDVVAMEDKFVSDAVRFIRNHAYENIKVEDILRYIPVSRRVLESRFRKLLGRTPHEEIIEVKVKLIKHLLSETELTLPIIAERIGFLNAEYMNVMFKKKTGMSPGSYRKKRKT
ncbi:XylR family transcriptional regulator [Paenibacillus allorhizosphaerae]|uniref:Xylose operon regulatory protein n=1 Tax=Paenibacillus allorhizosphaerae TaxID=2849866 RepID=A0ABM8VQM3_9BACL|nr:DNA-binding transcriptional regulator [Paenibacillus allorhizosphaerae]CAG7654351.1 Xylose operon regulatory protein [Paenibacillus allorhizosphaerae]